MYKPLSPLAYAKMQNPTSRILSPIDTIFSVFGSTLAFWCGTFIAWFIGTAIGHACATSTFNPFDLISFGPVTLLLSPFAYTFGFLIPLTLITTFMIGVYTESPKLRLALLSFILALAIFSSYIFFYRFIDS